MAKLSKSTNLDLKIIDSHAIQIRKEWIAKIGRANGNWKVPQTLDTFSMCY